MSIVLIIVLNLTLNDAWFKKHWGWIAFLLIVPAAILENFKVGYSTMRIMFMKVVYSLLSFLLVGMAFGSALTGWHIDQFQKIPGVKAIVLRRLRAMNVMPPDCPSPGTSQWECPP